MRIGIFTDTYTPFINGVTTSVVMLKKALEKKGHTVYIVTVNAENLKYQIEENVIVTIYSKSLVGLLRHEYRRKRILKEKLKKLFDDINW